MKSKKKLLCPSPGLFSSDWLKLACSYFDVDADATLTASEFEKLLPKYDIVLSRFDRQFDRELLSRCRLQYIVSPTTGLTHIDLAAAADLRIEVISLQGEIEFLKTIRATAEHTVALILALKRDLIPSSRAAERHGKLREEMRGTEINGSSIGVVGMGRLGSAVLDLCSAFGARTFYYDPFVNLPRTRHVKLHSLEELLFEVDVLSVHANYTAENRNLISAELLEKARLDIFINTARGELVDEPALIQAFNCGRIKKLGLDVISEENLETRIRSEILKLAKSSNNIIITPHIGGATIESVSRTDSFIIQKLLKSIGYIK